MPMITDSSQLTTTWLTDTLNTATNPVMQFRVVRAGQSSVSTFHHLEVHYTHADATLPNRLFLKLIRVDYPEFFGKELTFYREIAPQVQARYPEFNILTCYSGDYDPANGRAYLLFEDVSRTHASIQELEPTPAHYKQIIDGFAMLHAFWWAHPLLGDKFGHSHSPDSLDMMLRQAKEKFTAMCTMPYTLDPHWHIVLGRATDSWVAQRYQQMLNGEGMTIVHRDTHPRNFLYPRTEDAHYRPLIIDWDAWRIDHGTVDLAYMMAFYWSPLQRATHEIPLLQYYHERLEVYGVVNYTWENCLQDYKRSIVRCLLFMLSAWRPERQAGDHWWQVIERGIQAYADFDDEI